MIFALSMLQIVTATVTIETVSPAVGSVQGGSLVHVTGTGFVASGSEKSGCAFSDTSTFRGGSLSPASTVFNSTLLQCEVPNATFLMSNSGGECVVSSTITYTGLCFKWRDSPMFYNVVIQWPTLMPVFMQGL